MRARIAPLIILLAVLTFSCSHKPKKSTRPAMTASGQKLYAVIVDFTAFYLNGPQQANGPDKHLPKNTLMTVIRPAFGYSKVKLEANGQEGYVSTADIHTAPADLAASVQASPSPLPSPSASPSPEGIFPRESPSSEVTTPAPRESPTPEPSAPIDSPSQTPSPEPTTSVDSVFPRFTPSSSDSPVSEPTALPSPGSGN